MAHSLVLLSFLLLFTFSNTLAQETQWITPSPAGNERDFTEDPIYAVNSVVQLKWGTSSPSYSIWLWQQAGAGIGAASAGSPIYTKANGQTEAGGTPWQVNTENFLLSASNVFFFALGPNGTLIGATTSHYFNITDAPISSSSTSSSSSASTTAPSSSITAVPSTTANLPATSSTSASASASANQGNGSSNVTGIGLGVGLGVGIPIILLLAALLFLKIRQLGGANKATNAPSLYQEGHSEYFKPKVDDAERPVELPGGRSSQL